MTNGQRAALIQALAFALLFAIPTSILVNAPPDATSPLTWAALGAGMLGLLELMAACVCLHWTGRAIVRCRDCQTVRNINDQECPRCGSK